MKKGWKPQSQKWERRRSTLSKLRNLLVLRNQFALANAWVPRGVPLAIRPVDGFEPFLQSMRRNLRMNEVVRRRRVSVELFDYFTSKATYSANCKVCPNWAVELKVAMRERCLR